MKYCSKCSEKIQFGEVPGDDIPRFHCTNCNTIHYQNPKIVVGAIPRWQEKVLLCKRAIEPRYGLWTLPAGFLENGESVQTGAARETLEEAKAEIDIVRLFSVYSLPHVGQVYLMFLADLKNLNYGSGRESLEVDLFKKEEIPWEEIAFSAVRFTLEHYFNPSGSVNGEVHMGSSHKRRVACS
ncbi:NUDIX hydrolase [bacterium]|nr:NUDIX hydrolase [bacterium]